MHPVLRCGGVALPSTVNPRRCRRAAPAARCAHRDAIGRLGRTFDRDHRGLLRVSAFDARMKAPRPDRGGGRACSPAAPPAPLRSRPRYRAAGTSWVPVSPARARLSCASAAAARDAYGPARTCCQAPEVCSRTGWPSVVTCAATSAARDAVRNEAITISNGPAAASVDDAAAPADEAVGGSAAAASVPGG